MEKIVIEGGHRLAGEIEAGGAKNAALILGGLAAEGETTIHRVYHLDRGYETLDEKMRSLGTLLQRQPIY